MTVDYDAPRRAPVDAEEDSLPTLGATVSVLDIDDADEADSFELPDADLSGEEFTVRVVPKQADEFTCSSCFLVYHRSRLARGHNGTSVCTDCA